MKFLDRSSEMKRLDELMVTGDGGIAVIYGRRRVGKTRLLLEWVRKHRGLYSVADQSASGVQRRYFSEVIGEKFEGFSEVEYRDWRSLLDRLARESKNKDWQGPIVIDELPYLVTASKELPSVLQQWVDHSARSSRLVVAIAGSSQRMMQGLVMDANSPLYGRARQILEIKPLDALYLRDAFSLNSIIELVEHWTAWGGIPRYWELAVAINKSIESQIDELVLNPMGPLHTEPDRLLLDEIPPAVALRPILDIIGSGAHRISEIAARMGQPATSLVRPLERLMGMDLVERQIPFGESPKSGKRSLYKISDPFFRLWFRVIAPHRGLLATATREIRLHLLRKYWQSLAATAWEELCRGKIPSLNPSCLIGQSGPWKPASRFWQTHGHEWDIISDSIDGRHLLLGEVKWSRKPYKMDEIRQMGRQILAKGVPSLPKPYNSLQILRAIFIPESIQKISKTPEGVFVVTGEDLVRDEV